MKERMEGSIDFAIPDVENEVVVERDVFIFESDEGGGRGGGEEFNDLSQCPCDKRLL